MKLVRLINMFLAETYSRVRIVKNFSNMFSIGKGEVLWPLLFNCALDYAIRRVQVNQDGVKLNGTHHLLIYADDVNIFGERTHTIKRKAEALIVNSKSLD
jgi:hypothetical protein